MEFRSLTAREVEMNKECTARLRVTICIVLLAVCLVLAGISPIPAQGEPMATDPYAQAATTTLDDGSYLVDVSLEGGTGRASVTSPAQVTVANSKAAASIEWSSPHYDYMLVAGECYLPINEEGNSVFEIPILAFDEPFTVVADTTAMSQPHEIEYQLTFDTASAMALGTESKHNALLIALPVIAGGVVVAFLIARRVRAKREAAPSSTTESA